MDGKAGGAEAGGGAEVTEEEGKALGDAEPAGIEGVIHVFESQEEHREEKGERRVKESDRGEEKHQEKHLDGPEKEQLYQLVEDTASDRIKHSPGRTSNR